MSHFSPTKPRVVASPLVYRLTSEMSAPGRATSKSSATCDFSPVPRTTGDELSGKGPRVLWSLCGWLEQLADGDEHSSDVGKSGSHIPVSAEMYPALVVGDGRAAFAPVAASVDCVLKMSQATSVRTVGWIRPGSRDGSIWEVLTRMAFDMTLTPDQDRAPLARWVLTRISPFIRIALRNSSPL